jgi:hypothetical protein
MHENMRTLLNAYLDNELHGTRLLEMKVHLASCQACQEELKDLRQVSDLLQAAPAPEFMPADRFVSNLNLSLPRQALRDRPPKPGSLAWWAVPAGLLALWFFVRTVFALSSMITAADATGLLGNAANWLNGGQHAIWFEAAMGLFGGQAGGAQPTLSVLNNVSVISENLLNGFLWQAVIVLLYWGWLAAWWLQRGPKQMKVTATPSRS